MKIELIDNKVKLSPEPFELFMYKLTDLFMIIGPNCAMETIITKTSQPSGIRSIFLYTLSHSFSHWAKLKEFIEQNNNEQLVKEIII